MIPIVEHHVPDVRPLERARAEALAARLAADDPQLTLPPGLRHLAAARVGGGATLHLDDLTTIPNLERRYPVTFLQHRARLRAEDGDWLASCAGPVAGYEDYCRTRLALGSVRWVHPRPLGPALGVAAACWTDRAVRAALVEAVRVGELRQVHPHMGCFPVWSLAALLQRTARRPLRVIAPPPGLTRLVNDKLWFTLSTRRLLGEHSVPATYEAWNSSTLARIVRVLAARSRTIVVKLPDSAGGFGNLVLESDRFRDRPLGEIRRAVAGGLDEIGWNGSGRLLVGSWETQVLCSPSVQLWIPPPGQGRALVEGLFVQIVERTRGGFLGSRPARFPPDLTHAIVDRAWLLGHLYQHLGYVGRCSLDLLLVGRDLDTCRIEFVECNGRWGGTSLPMTLMNRLCGDWSRRPYANLELCVPGLEHASFAEVLSAFDDDLYDARDGRGTVVLYNPGALRARQGLDALVLAEDWSAAERRLTDEIPQHLARWVAERTPRQPA